MTVKSITVLIPTLNSIEFMQECLESVINQTLEALEIIVIDAGSTDGTLELIESYQKKDGRIRIIHSEKKSYGYQLNMGITMARGDYIGIVESDDVVELDMYETLLEVAIEKDADFVKSNFAHYAVTEDKQEMIIPETIISKSIIGKVINPIEYKNIYLEDFYLWRGIYKREFLIKNKIVFHESTGAAYQDIGFLYQTFALAKRVVYLENCFYKYRRNNSNSSTYSPKAFSYLAGEYTYILEKLKKNRTMNQEWDSLFYQKMFIQCRSRFRLLAFHGGDFKDVKSDILCLQRILKEAYIQQKINLSLWSMQSQIEFFMMTEDISAYMEYYRVQMVAKRQCVNNMIVGLKSFSEIILVGDSKAAPFLYTLLKGNYINTIVNICDNDRNKWGEVRMGLKIISVEQATEVKGNSAFLISSVKAKKELIQQLISLGIRERQIFIYDLGIDWLLLP